MPLATLSVPAFIHSPTKTVGAEESADTSFWRDMIMGNNVLINRSLTEDGGAMVGESRLTRERMLGTMRALEAALAKPTPKREAAWGSFVLQALSTLEGVMRKQAEELEDEDSTLAAIARDQPRFLSRIQQLREQYQDLVRQIHSLHEQLSADDLPQTGEIRQRLEWILTAIRHFQSKETDLIFEAISVDIGAAD
jgi:chromosome segregation ATPase